MATFSRLHKRLHYGVIDKYGRLIWKIEWDTGPCQVTQEQLPRGFALEVDPERELAALLPEPWIGTAESTELSELLKSWEWLDCYAEVLAFELPRDGSLKSKLAHTVLMRESTLAFSTMCSNRVPSDLYMFHWADEFMRAVDRVVRLWEDNDL